MTWKGASGAVADAATAATVATSVTMMPPLTQEEFEAQKAKLLG